MAYLIARFLHFVFFVLWFGNALHGAEEALQFARQTPSESTATEGGMNWGAIRGAVGGLGTIGSGLWLIHLLGGFSAVPWPIHAGLALTVVTALIGTLAMGRGWGLLVSGRAAGAPLTELESRARRVGTWGRVMQGLLLTVLFLMAFRHVL